VTQYAVAVAVTVAALVVQGSDTQSPNKLMLKFARRHNNAIGFDPEVSKKRQKKASNTRWSCRGLFPTTGMCQLLSTCHMWPSITMTDWIIPGTEETFDCVPT
jgi:hypothetical protein